MRRVLYGRCLPKWGHRRGLWPQRCRMHAVRNRLHLRSCPTMHRPNNQLVRHHELPGVLFWRGLRNESHGQCVRSPWGGVRAMRPQQCLRQKWSVCTQPINQVACERDTRRGDAQGHQWRGLGHSRWLCPRRIRELDVPPLERTQRRPDSLRRKLQP
jgi:hypothetical protein